MIETIPNRKYLYLTVFTGNLMAFITGTTVTWSSPMIPKLLSNTTYDNPFGRVVTTSEASWFGAFYGIGGIFGPVLAGYTLSKFGRKNCAVFFGGLPFVISFFMLSFSDTVVWYYISRFILGVASGSIYVVIPIYNGEVAEVSIRGRICASISTFETFGELMSYCLGPYLTIFWYNMSLTILATFATVLGFIILPESPYYLIEKNDRDGAEAALMKLRCASKEGVKSELETIAATVEESKANQGSVKDIFKSRALRKAFIIVMGLLCFQLLSGLIPIVFYSQTIFKESTTDLSPELCAIAIGVTEFCSSLITPNIVDKLGRRPMLVASASGMFTSNFFLGLYFCLKYYSFDVSNFFWLPVVCLVFYIFSFIMGFGPLIWTVMGEVFPSNMKSAATTSTCVVYWALIFVFGKFLALISDPLGIFVCFWSFAAGCLFAIVFVLTYVIETKGKNFQEIQDILSK